jgi:hypothetical protein
MIKIIQYIFKALQGEKKEVESQTNKDVATENKSPILAHFCLKDGGSMYVKRDENGTITKEILEREKSL